MLTNFHELVIYDCVPAPSEDDEPHVARISRYSYEDFEKRFDELYDQISREAVYSGQFDDRFKVDVSRHGTQQFDAHFLSKSGRGDCDSPRTFTQTSRSLRRQN